MLVGSCVEVPDPDPDPDPGHQILGSEHILLVARVAEAVAVAAGAADADADADAVQTGYGLIDSP